MKTGTKVGMIAALAALTAAAIMGVAGAASGRDDAGAAARGGTYRVEWESSFDFTSGFDPTGEYSVQAFGIYSNLLVRTLVGYNHAAGTAGNVLVPDLATESRNHLGGRAHVHVHAQERRQVRAAAQSRDHLEGRRVRVPAHRHAVGRRAVRLLLRRDPGHGRVRGRQGEVDLRHLDARTRARSSSTSARRPATSATASRCRPRARCRARWPAASRSPGPTAAT